MRKLDRPALIALLIGALALALCLSFWPGIMIWDSSAQYGESLSGVYDDWHPPLMAWIWRLLVPLMPGPGPMLLLQLSLYGAALGGLAWRAWVRGDGRQACWLAATALFPPTLFLMTMVIKDALMAAMLLAAFALLAHFRDTGNRLSRVSGVALVVIASCLRFNAFLAGVPLLLMAIPLQRIASRRARALVLTAAALLLLLAMPVANRLLRAKPSGVQLSLVIFDLAGIAAQSGSDAFPPLPVKDPVAVIRGCYSPEAWDPFSWWVDTLCPAHFGMIRHAFDAQRINPEFFWIRAILAHPIAYAQHRLAHWNIDSLFLVRQVPQYWIVSASDPNIWNYHVQPNRFNRAVIAATWIVTATPLGWPCWWMALAFGVMLLARGKFQIFALASSALLYGFGYGAFGVAAELRYYFWTILAASVAAVMFAGYWRQLPVARRPDRLHRALAVTPLLLVTLLGFAWRWL